MGALTDAILRVIWVCSLAVWITLALLATGLATLVLTYFLAYLALVCTG